MPATRPNTIPATRANIDEGTTKHDYTMAFHSQTACNLSGIVFEFAKAMERICAEARAGGHGTDWKNNHPIARLYAEQISSLTRGRDWTEAYKICEERSKS